MKEKLLFAVIASAAVFASACSNETSTLEGKWVEPIPGMEDKVQGGFVKARRTCDIYKYGDITI